MMVKFDARRACVLGMAAACMAPSVAMAVGGAGTVANTRDYVGRVRTENDFFGSGSLIQPNTAFAPYVLTAAHVLNFTAVTNAGTGGTLDYIRQHFETYYDAGKGDPYLALGVQNPIFSAIADGTPFAADQGDVGIMLVLNAQKIKTTPGVLGAAADVPAVGDNITLVGYSGTALGDAAKVGTGKVNTSPAANDYANFLVPPSVNYTQPGDSGGPGLKMIDGKETIVSISSGGKVTEPMGTVAAAGSFFEVKTSTYRDFVIGDGQGGKAVINRFAGAANSGWGVPATWARGSAGANAAPKDNDVVDLDPTGDSDAAAYTVTLTTPSASLEGMLNDVHIVANDNLTVSGSTGVLNAGIIDLSPGSTLRVNHSIQNVGSVNLRGLTIIGASLPTASYAVYNSGTITTTNNQLVVGNADQTAIFTNLATGTFNASAVNTIDFLGNSGTVNLQFGTMQLISGANRANANFNVVGIPVPQGQVNVTQLKVVFTFLNSGNLTLDGSSMSVNFGANPNNAPLLQNGPGGRILMTPGATATTAYWAQNNGTIEMQANATDAASFTVTPGTAGNLAFPGVFDGGGASSLKFVQLVPGALKPQVNMVSSTFKNNSVITGPGVVSLTGQSSFDQTRIPAANADNQNAVDFAYSDALGNFEISNKNLGAVLAGFTQPLAIEELCIDNSVVNLLDANANEAFAGQEVLYVQYLGLANNSVLNLNGHIVYTLGYDPDCNDGTGTVNPGAGGMIIIVPEPSMALLAGGGVLALARRRRR